MNWEQHGELFVLSEKLSCYTMYTVNCQHAALSEKKKDSSVERKDNCKDTYVSIPLK